MTASRGRPRRPGPAAPNAGSAGLGVWRARLAALEGAEPSGPLASGRKFALENKLTRFGQVVPFAEETRATQRASGCPWSGVPDSALGTAVTVEVPGSQRNGERQPGLQSWQGAAGSQRPQQSCWDGSPGPRALAIGSWTRLPRGFPLRRLPSRGQRSSQEMTRFFPPHLRFVEDFRVSAVTFRLKQPCSGVRVTGDGRWPPGSWRVWRVDLREGQSLLPSPGAVRLCPWGSQVQPATHRWPGLAQPFATPSGRLGPEPTQGQLVPVPRGLGREQTLTRAPGSLVGQEAWPRAAGPERPAAGREAGAQLTAGGQGAAGNTGLASHCWLRMWLCRMTAP